MQALAISDDRNHRVGSMGVKMTAVARDVADLYVHASRGTKLWMSAPRTRRSAPAVNLATCAAGP